MSTTLRFPVTVLCGLGTVAAILSEVAVHLRITRQELQERLFGK